MKLSIITINYNNAAGLKKTLNSVASQTCTDFEHIIVDGASTDESVEIIREYENTLSSRLSPLASRLNWISEPDTGIYNAMNKGVRMANGEYTLMLNSGDYLVDENVISSIMLILDGTDIVQGNRIEEIDGKYFRYQGYAKSDISYFEIMRGQFLHQASFCKKILFESYGYFDESYKIVSDTKFFMTCLGKEDATYKYVNIDVVNYDMMGISAECSGKWYLLRQEEEIRLRKELYSNKLIKFYFENEKKIRLYDKLYKHKWLWYIVMFLVRIYDSIYPQEVYVKRTKI